MTDNNNSETVLRDESRGFVEKAMHASLIAEVSGFAATALALDAMAREQARLSLPQCKATTSDCLNL
ncbi:hypothetical protein [Pacificibacter marinus]|uniref:hypothetical protein n=1 Tax=Pacificibacter marinus TaxID=658057 RepID=UPI001C06A95D|nr:hypothetical protein [Pacificibacter marinus]MBU2868018.1 hypothetical protein [Pacificibacter marinus]